MFHLASSPTPTKRPAASHQRWFAPDRVLAATPKKARPRRIVEHGRGEKVRSGDVLAAQGSGEGGQAAGSGAAAHQPCRGAGNEDLPSKKNRWDDTQSDERVGEQNCFQPRYERRDQGLIYVAKGRMVARGQKVELVSVVAVTSTDEHLQRDRRDADGEDPGIKPTPEVRLRSRSITRWLSLDHYDFGCAMHCVAPDFRGRRPSFDPPFRRPGCRVAPRKNTLRRGPAFLRQFVVARCAAAAAKA